MIYGKLYSFFGTLMHRSKYTLLNRAVLFQHLHLTPPLMHQSKIHLPQNLQQIVHNQPVKRITGLSSSFRFPFNDLYHGIYPRYHNADP